jgi:hypothetical protein
MKTRYFHGGSRKLYVGDYILPPTETGVEGMVGNPHYRRDRVYVVTDIQVAESYGSAAPKPVVYEVVPEGEIEPDPDHPGSDISFACPKARITALHKIPGKVIKKNRKAMLRRAHALEKSRAGKP